jgi:hypothetical protein
MVVYVVLEKAPYWITQRLRHLTISNGGFFSIVSPSSQVEVLTLRMSVVWGTIPKLTSAKCNLFQLNGIPEFYGSYKEEHDGQ